MVRVFEDAGGEGGEGRESEKEGEDRGKGLGHLKKGGGEQR